MMKTIFFQVHLVRSYRVGELPDIAISNANVIKALKNLCQRDDQSAQIVLRLLATSLANNSTDGQLQDLNDASPKQ